MNELFIVLLQFTPNSPPHSSVAGHNLLFEIVSALYSEWLLYALNSITKMMHVRLLPVCARG